VNPFDDGEFTPDPPGEEIRYPLYRFLGEPLFLSERTGIILLLSLAAILIFLFLVYSAVCRRELSGQIRMGLRCSWAVLLLFGFLWGSFFVSDRILMVLLTLPGIPPGAASYKGLGQISLMGLPIFFLLSGFIRLLPMPKDPLFYGNAGMITALIGFPALLMWDITRLIPGLWSLLCIIPGRFLKKSVPLYGCVLLYPVQALAAFNVLPAKGSGGISGLSPDNGTLVFIGLSLFFLPPLLLFLRGRALSGVSGRGEEPREDAGGEPGATNGYAG
jgi:hypothetical protein